jgi:drug/metabolite transporter (DMT)-like permease
MHAALLTVLLFAASAIAAERASRYWGGQRANLIRLCVATLVMGAVTLVFHRPTLEPATYGWLFLSGMVGFGLGDIALFLAYVRIGARLTILLNLCTAPLWSAAVEWLWMDVGLRPMEMGAGVIILVGVIMAILSREPGAAHHVGSRWAGVLFGLAAGWGQGTGAVISRRAFAAAREAGFDLPGFSAAAQRVSGGFLTVLVLTAIFLAVRRTSLPRPRVQASRRKAVAWLLATTFCGPILGVTCFQWALSVTPSAIVNTIVATTPIAMIPMTMLADRERPRPLSVLGALVAVAGVVLMLRGQSG